MFPDERRTALTIYNDGGAVVRQSAEVTLPAGESILEVSGLPGGIRPATALLRHGGAAVAPRPGSDAESDSGTGPRLRITGREFLPPVGDAHAILGASIGGRVELIGADGVGRTGRLLSAGDPVVVEFAEGIEIAPAGTIRIATLEGNADRPEGRGVTPALRWRLNSGAGGVEPVEHSFLTDGIGWRADYVAALNAGRDALDLTAWVRIENGTRTEFRDARIDLIAGGMPVPRAPEAPARVGGPAVGLPPPPEAAASEEEPAEVRRYAPEQPVTLRPDSTTDVSLFHAAGLPVRRIFVLESWPYVNTAVLPTNRPRRLEERLLVAGDADRNPGEALPAGTVLLYETDAAGAMRFVGGNQVAHTPAGGAMEIALGTSSDVVAERVLTSRRGAPRGAPNFEAGFLVTVHNRGTATATARIVEHFTGEWTAADESHTSTRPEPGTLVYEVEVPAGGMVPVSFTVRSVVGSGHAAPGPTAPGLPGAAARP